MSTFLLFHPQILWKYRHVHKQLLFTTNLHDTNNNAFTTFIDCVVIYLWLFQRWHIVKRNVSFITPPVALQSETTTDCDTSIRTFIFRQLYKGTVCPTPRCCWRLKLCQLGIYFHLLVPVCSNAKLLLQRMRIIIIMSLSSVGRREGINNHFRSSRGQ